MKTFRASIIGLTVLVGIAGCSTSTPKVRSSHRPDSTTVARVENARILYRMGKMDDAEQELQRVLAVQAGNPAALYYLVLIQKSRAKKQAREDAIPHIYYQTIPQQRIY